MAKALYIHWPFCLKKCPYCDFNSHVRAEVDYAAWQDALIQDMRHEFALANSGALTSIFFGGGTPSLMPPSLVEALLNEAEKLWGFDPGIEITLEANPSSVEAGNFANLASAGVNRVSLGVQSLNDATLQFLGRLHNAGDALAALETAQTNFARVSFDLIYAIRGQDSAAWEAELRRALGLGTSHLSLYQLTIEPGTKLATDVRRGEYTPMDDDEAAELYALTTEVMSARGLPPYEISNYAKGGEESRHNLTYWRYQDYVGIGPGAHGRRGGYATTRHKKPENWLAAITSAGSGIAEERAIGSAEAASEALMMGLRLMEGVDLAALSSRFTMPESALINMGKWGLYRKEGLLWNDGPRYGITARGMGVLDAILGEVVLCDSDDLP